MKYRVLITGGAGFIGSHLADALLAQGYSVRVLDSLCPDVHASGQVSPSYLAADVDLRIGDVRDARAVSRALEGVDAVYHLAGLAGVTHSMYRIHDYVDVNARGTAVLLEGLAKHPVRKLILASSMSVYGEGLYRDQDGREISVARRSAAQLRRSEWEYTDEQRRPLIPQPTPESKTPELESIYASSKLVQEQQCLIAGRAYDIPTTVLRLSSVYGPRLALAKPHVGVISSFASRLLKGRAPLVHEDGHQKRDYVSVQDVVQACLACLTQPKSDGLIFNIGSGRPVSILEVASQLALALGKTPAAEVSGKFRAGDVRHCFADITRAREVLGYSPRVGLEQGIRELAQELERSHSSPAESSGESAPALDAEVQIGGIS